MEYSKVGFEINGYRILLVTFENTDTGIQKDFWIPYAAYLELRKQRKLYRSLLDYEKQLGRFVAEDRKLIDKIDRAKYMVENYFDCQLGA